MKCQKCGRKKREKVEHFLVNVSIIEGRHFAWPNMDSFVLVSVGNQNKCTNIKKQTDCPYFNEYFVFEFNTKLDKLMDLNIMLTVIQPRTCCAKKKTLGFFRMDIGTVWFQCEHQFYHKWAVITSEDLTSGPKGYLKVDIGIQTKDEIPRLPVLSHEETDVIEGNLLLPEGIALERQKAKYIFNVYKGDGFPFCPKKKLFVEVIFAGQRGKTSALVKRNSEELVGWNEMLVFTELFPPLCQRVIVNLTFTGSCTNTVRASRYITLSLISNDEQNGYLPTFGPTYLYFYSREEFGSGYAGRLLMAMQTIVQEDSDLTGIKSKKIHNENIPSFNEKAVWSDEEAILYAILFDVTLIDKKYSHLPVHFELTFGDNSSQQGNVSQALRPKSKNKYFSYLEYEENKPCLNVQSVLPDFRRRMFFSNIILKIKETLKLRIEKINELFSENVFFRSSLEIEEEILDTVNILIKFCETFIIDVERTIHNFPTNLDRERLNFCSQEIKAILTVLPKLYESNKKMKSFRRLQKIYRKIEPLSENAQDSWPDIFLSFVVDKKVIAYKQIKARDIIFSLMDEESGEYCGKIQTLFFEPSSYLLQFMEHTLICKAEVMLWLGLKTEINHFLRVIPDGFITNDSPLNADIDTNIPITNNIAINIVKSIYSNEIHYFQCRAHIYQAKLTPGYDESGLADAFVRIVIGGDCAQTQVKTGTLNPFWDQTLIFKNIILYGSERYIQDNPPTVVLEVYDQDMCYKVDFVGRGTIKPSVKILYESYSFPQFPPQLQWVKVHNYNGEMTGEILMCAELLEVSAAGVGSNILEDNKEVTDEKQQQQGALLTIPKDIKPITTLYRIELLFWGVRHLKKVHMLSITKPFVTISCYDETVTSDIINTKQDLNFEEYTQHIDLMLPNQSEFVPPLIIKMFDSRSFGRNVYAGNNLVHLSSFLIKPVTKLEWEQVMSGLITKSIDVFEPSRSSILFATKKYVYSLVLNPIKERSIKFAKRERCDLLRKICCFLCGKRDKDKNTKKSNVYEEEDYNVDYEEQFNDWWTKYYLSIEYSSDSERLKSSQNVVDSALTGTSKSRATLKRVSFQEEVTDGQQNKNNVIEQQNKGDILPIDKEAKENDKITLKIYNKELERQPEFGGFTDLLLSFPIYKGKRSGDETIDSEKITGKLKGNIKLYKLVEDTQTTESVNNKVEYVTLSGFDLKNGFFQDAPSNENVNFIVRIYCVRAYNLKPKDISGKSDPYVYVKMGEQIISDRQDYVSKDVNPIFGKCFEMRGTFPFDDQVTVQIWDYDMQTSDDLIGETIVDIENRYYSKHRARCGLPKHYMETGCYAWRCQKKPTEILDGLCSKFNLGKPEYQKTSVKVAFKEFIPQHLMLKHMALLSRKTQEMSDDGDKKKRWSVKSSLISHHDEEDVEIIITDVDKEILALNALHHWNEMPLIGFTIVPEHVETRSLFLPSRPGVEQGKIELWIDIFPTSDLLPPPKTDITPRKPIPYELRVVIWNLEDVLLVEDDVFAGEKKSDIFVKGWLADQSNEQCTDIHYRSFTGEGNFNWRFVFNFQYLVAEKKVLFVKKDGMFSDEYELKLPCKLYLQVWDNDTFSKDDFIGALTIDLVTFPKGARSSKTCTLDIISHKAQTFNLFKVKRSKGWWPFKGSKEDKKFTILAGKLEAEFELVTQDESLKNPAGLGRNAPQPLPPPNRPDTSFSWIKNPWRTLKFIICKQYKWKLIKFLLFVLLIGMVILCIYNVPRATVDKIINSI